MALSGEDKADVSRAFGPKAAKAVAGATNDAKNKAVHAKMGMRAENLKKNYRGVHPLAEHKSSRRNLEKQY